MGKLKKYQTEEERKEAYRLSSKIYYWKNKERVDKVCRERYQNKIKSNNELREDL